jgi:hypothetical protein
LTVLFLSYLSFFSFLSLPNFTYLFLFPFLLVFIISFHVSYFFSLSVSYPHPFLCFISSLSPYIIFLTCLLSFTLLSFYPVTFPFILSLSLSLSLLLFYLRNERPSNPESLFTPRLTLTYSLSVKLSLTLALKT